MINIHQPQESIDQNEVFMSDTTRCQMSMKMEQHQVFLRNPAYVTHAFGQLHWPMSFLLLAQCNCCCSP